MNNRRPRPAKTLVEHRKRVLQEARRVTNLSQRAFAEKIEKKYSFVARRELGFDYMTIDNVCSWAKGCDMDPIVLFAMLVEHQEQQELPVEGNNEPAT